MYKGHVTFREKNCGCVLVFGRTNRKPLFELFCVEHEVEVTPPESPEVVAEEPTPPQATATEEPTGE